MKIIAKIIRTFFILIGFKRVNKFELTFVSELPIMKAI